jgi:hypothetical protein
MEIQININDYLENKNIKIFDNTDVDNIIFQKMLLLYNALDEGWCIKKRKDSYIFTKNHDNNNEYHDKTYLEKFIKSNLDVRKVLKQ